MIISRGLTAAAVMTLVAVGTSTPAKALGPPPDGMYAFTEAGAPASTWKIYALCDAPSRQRAIPDFTDPVVAADLCALNVISTTARLVSRQERQANYSGRARLTSDLWTFQVAEGRWRGMSGRQQRAQHGNVCVRRCFTGRNAYQHSR